MEASREARDLALKNGMPGLMKSASERLKRQELALKGTQTALDGVNAAIAKIDDEQMKLDLDKAKDAPKGPKGR